MPLTPEQAKEKERARTARYREKNREKLNAQSKAYYWAHKDDPKTKAHNSERLKAYYEANSDKLRESAKVCKRTDAGRLTAMRASKKHYLNNREKRLAESAEYWREHMDRITAQNAIRKVTGLRAKDMPPELIEAKAAQIKLFRAIKYAYSLD